MNDDYKNYRELLIVNAGGELYVVEAPAHEAEISDLVEFDIDRSAGAIGIVIDKMWCNRTEREYRCIARINRIYQAKVIYCEKWSTVPTEE